MKGKRLGFIMTLVLIMALAMPAWAADTKIDSVKLDFSYSGEEPKSGNEIGRIHVKAPDGQPFTVEYAEYSNEGDVWVVGDRPLVHVELTAKSGYRFSSTSKSRFTLNGCSAVYKKARIYDDGTQMELEVYLKRIGGTLSSVQNLEWGGNVAYWDPLEGSKEYEVRLYRDEKSVVTVKTTDSSYNFANNMDREGSYTFRVRAIASYNSRAGEWSDYSEDYYIDEDEVWYYGGSGAWQQNARGWWYAYSGGGYPRSCWKLIDNAWYYFDGEGYMTTGWRRIDGNYYYLGPDGKMRTGWQQIDGAWYYLDGSGVRTTDWQYVNGRWYYMNSSGVMQVGWQRINGDWYYLDGSGAMMTGWQYINGAWYYMDGSGVMYAGRWTPDGRYVDYNGVWVQQ